MAFYGQTREKAQAAHEWAKKIGQDFSYSC